MNLATIAWKSIRQRGVASSLTGLSVALGVMLMVAVLVMYSIVDRAFSQNSVGYQLIVGPKGSDLDLVLSTVYHIRPPIENLPYRYYKELKQNPLVVDAVPIALGDRSQQGAFPIVGTTNEFFVVPYAGDKKFRIRTDLDEPGFGDTFGAIIGSRVARENGWDLGTKFKLVHAGQQEHVHDEEFTVHGVMAPTGTPNDATVFVYLEGFYMISGHETPLDEAAQREAEFFGETIPPDELERLRAKARKEQEAHASGAHHLHATPDVQKEVTAILVNMRTETAAALFASQMKSGFKVQAVNPIRPMVQLKEVLVGNVVLVILVLTGLVIVVSGIGIFVSIYNSMADRRKELAIMRALGAQRGTVFSIILAESVLLCVGGGVLGFVLGHALVFAAAPYIEDQTGLIVNPLAFHMAEAYLIPGLIVLASLVGLIPALSAYRTDVARVLAD